MAAEDSILDPIPKFVTSSKWASRISDKDVTDTDDGSLTISQALLRERTSSRSIDVVNARYKTSQQLHEINDRVREAIAQFEKVFGEPAGVEMDEEDERSLGSLLDDYERLALDRDTLLGNLGSFFTGIRESVRESDAMLLQLVSTEVETPEMAIQRAEMQDLLTHHKAKTSEITQGLRDVYTESVGSLQELISKLQSELETEGSRMKLSKMERALGIANTKIETIQTQMRRTLTQLSESEVQAKMLQESLDNQRRKGEESEAAFTRMRIELADEMTKLKQELKEVTVRANEYKRRSEKAEGELKEALDRVHMVEERSDKNFQQRKDLEELVRNLEDQVAEAKDQGQETSGALDELQIQLQKKSKEARDNFGKLRKLRSVVEAQLQAAVEERNMHRLQLRLNSLLEAVPIMADTGDLDPDHFKAVLRSLDAFDKEMMRVQAEVSEFRDNPALARTDAIRDLVNLCLEKFGSIKDMKEIRRILILYFDQQERLVDYAKEEALRDARPLNLDESILDTPKKMASDMEDSDDDTLEDQVERMTGPSSSAYKEAVERKEKEEAEIEASKREAFLAALDGNEPLMRQKLIDFLQTEGEVTRENLDFLEESGTLPEGSVDKVVTLLNTKIQSTVRNLTSQLVQKSDEAEQLSKEHALTAAQLNSLNKLVQDAVQDEGTVNLEAFETFSTEDETFAHLRDSIMGAIAVVAQSSVKHIEKSASTSQPLVKTAPEQLKSTGKIETISAVSKEPKRIVKALPKTPSQLDPVSGDAHFIADSASVTSTISGIDDGPTHLDHKDEDITALPRVPIKGKVQPAFFSASPSPEPWSAPESVRSNTTPPPTTPSEPVPIHPEPQVQPSPQPELSKTPKPKVDPTLTEPPRQPPKYLPTPEPTTPKSPRKESDDPVRHDSQLDLPNEPLVPSSVKHEQRRAARLFYEHDKELSKKQKEMQRKARKARAEMERLQRLKREREQEMRDADLSKITDPVTRAIVRMERHHTAAAAKWEQKKLLIMRDRLLSMQAALAACCTLATEETTGELKLELDVAHSTMSFSYKTVNARDQLPGSMLVSRERFRRRTSVSPRKQKSGQKSKVPEGYRELRSVDEQTASLIDGLPYRYQTTRLRPARTPPSHGGTTTRLRFLPSGATVPHEQTLELGISLDDSTLQPLSPHKFTRKTVRSATDLSRAVDEEPAWSPPLGLISAPPIEPTAEDRVQFSNLYSKDFFHDTLQQRTTKGSPRRRKTAVEKSRDDRLKKLRDPTIPKRLSLPEEAKAERIAVLGASPRIHRAQEEFTMLISHGDLDPIPNAAVLIDSSL